MSREPEHCDKHDRYESWCMSCVCAEESFLDDENERLRERIAELEKERDEAREDAITTADKLARLSLKLIDGIVDHEKSGDYFKYGIAIIRKYE